MFYPPNHLNLFLGKSAPLRLLALALALQLNPVASAQTAHTFLPNGAKEDGFGASIVNTGRYVVIGAPLDDTKGTDAGAVYLFDTVSKRLVRKIYGYQASAGARFGTSIAVSGSTIVVGSPGKSGGQGEMSWHRFPSGQILGLFPGWVAGGGGFGASLAMSGSMVAVGAPNGTVELTPEGEPVVTLLGAGKAIALDLRNPFAIRYYSATDPEAGAHFGQTLACDGSLVLIGAPHASGPNGAEQGAVYGFDFNVPGTPPALTKIQALDGQAGDHFGSSIAFSSGQAFIGAPLATSAAGAVYPLRLNDFSLAPPLLGAAPGDRFGDGLSLNRSRLAVGAPGTANGPLNNAGAVWYYPDTNSLTGPSILTAAEPQEGEAFGSSLSLGGDSLGVASPSHSSLDKVRGAAHWLPGFPLDLPLSPVYSKGDAAPDLAGTFIQQAIQAQWNAAEIPVVLAPILAPKSKGMWTFAPGAPSLLLQSGTALQGDPALIGDLRETIANGSRYGMTRIILKGANVNARNRHALLYDNQPVVRTGHSPIGLNSDTVKTIGPILQSLAYGQAHLKLNANRSLETNATNDSVLWLHRPEVGDWTENTMTLREGVTATTEEVPELLGEILPHTAITQSDENEEPSYAFVAALGTQTTSNQAVFVNTTDSPVLRRGDEAPGGGLFQNFVGLTLHDDFYLVRATLRTGGTVNTRNNEGLWSNRNGTNELVLRKGVPTLGLPTGVSVKRFLAYALTDTGIVIAQCQMGGSGIKRNNDMVLLMIDLDGKVTVLEAEGNGLSDASGGRINVIQRLAIATDGSYQMQTSLSGAPAASNQALLQGRASEGALRPNVVIRKNDLITGLPSRIRSLRILPTSRSTGALGGGLPTTLLPKDEGPISLVTLQFMDRSEVLYRLGEIVD